MRLQTFLIGLVVALAAGCGRDRGIEPTALPAPSAAANVRVTGVALDADSDAPIPNATLTLLIIETGSRFEQPAQATTTSTDSNGRFVLNINGPVVNLRLRVETPGFESTGTWTNVVPGLDSVVRFNRTLTIRPGESIEFRMVVGDSCGFEDYRCRPVVVESPTGAEVELEVTPLDPLGEAGLVRSTREPGFPFPGYQTRLSAPPGRIFVIGGAPSPAHGRTRLSAVR